jgi:hypothetical protein
MTKYYLIRGDHVLSTIDSIGDVIALPLFGGGDPMSLLNEQHAANLMANLSLTAAQALAAMGLSDLRSSTIKTVFVAPNPVSIDVSGIAPYYLINIGAYALWQCDGQQDDLLRLHTALWPRAPAQTLGLLAVVQTFGSAFYPSAVRTATGMTTQQALDRRNRVATYLESLGFTNTAAVRTATTEHTQMLGITTALGYTAAQLWGKMVN